MPPITRFFNLGALLLTTISLSAADPAPSPLIILAQETPNASAWVLAPLDEAVPADIRQNLTLLREDLLDEGKTTPRTSLDAYRSGYQLCNSLISVLDERDKALVKAGVSLTQTQVASGGAPQGAEARRNYMMSWPQYRREEAQAEERKNQVRDALSVTKDRQKAEWSGRANQLRAGLDTVYASFRDAMRKDPAMIQAMAVPAQRPVSPKISSAPTQPAKPAPAPKLKPAALPPGAYTNSLGMVFVPVEGTNVLFCIHETRRQDYANYASDVPGVNSAWKSQNKNGIPCGHEDDHPVVGIKWSEARAFCEWLSKKEGKVCRLPTDKEWSYAVGIGRDERWTKDATPSSMNNKLQSLFPWGKTFPPETKDAVGNYADITLNTALPEAAFIGEYSDGFPTTSPVMSYKPNKNGIYDLGGNASEWCSDWFDETNTRKFTRGGSWFNNTRDNLLSANRFERSPEIDFQINYVGFRCVLEAP
jgi:hypothetical protein